MSVYADASLLVALFSVDAFTARARDFLRELEPTLVVSDFAAAELASALAKKLRVRDLSADEVRSAFASFDAWAGSRGPRLETTTADVSRAEAILRRLDLALRTPDALNLAIAERHEASLATFDVRMAESARALGLEVASV